MLSKFSMAACSAAFVLATPSLALADTVIEKVARTGVLTVGMRFEAVPYSYVDADGNLVGYSIDLLELIEAQVEAELDEDIVVQVVETDTLAERIPMLSRGEIDLACDELFSWERDRHVDFSISYGISPIGILTLADSELGDSASLAGQRLAVLTGSAGESVMALVQPEATLVPIASFEEAFNALDSKAVDAIADDVVILGGLALQRGYEAYRVPDQEPFQAVGISCMVPENNSTFLNMVNYAIGGLAQGYVSGDPGAVDMVNRWFGEDDGVVPLPTGLLEDFFGRLLARRSQVSPMPSNP